MRRLRIRAITRGIKAASLGVEKLKGSDEWSRSLQVHAFLGARHFHSQRPTGIVRWPAGQYGEVQRERNENLVIVARISTSSGNLALGIRSCLRACHRERLVVFCRNPGILTSEQKRPFANPGANGGRSGVLVDLGGITNYSPCAYVLTRGLHISPPFLLSLCMYLCGADYIVRSDRAELDKLNWVVGFLSFSFPFTY
ncbi:hypothetical protein BU24DRAFT_3587 [Aaosphaeria arxii CBS 175.79]|uniref:Uncharacterized protein n=1 Tax=Aaosphaeria arxii CBS 175.79 TaxID=1450172 RepID=A0A6A5Y5W6_9PLEO|nr:uncharacterized protein BU24DRAFT_3587 [Aaosphaeria arxii CBS 175.79]KAF2020593.1 hypothetical protein BU24DRAFT_3587 [Aaosphaeria arxii CBS 175.79]